MFWDTEEAEKISDLIPVAQVSIGVADTHSGKPVRWERGPAFPPLPAPATLNPLAKARISPKLTDALLWPINRYGGSESRPF